MRVKVAFLETDKNYLQRIVTALSSKYADKLQLYSYTDKEAAIAALRSERIAVLVCTTGFELTADELPANCGLAYLTDSMDVASYQGHPAICKFQKAEQIYKGILSVYAETSASSAAVRYQSGSMAMVILVTSPSGGGGASSVAAGLARRLALRGSRVLYLNYEKLGMVDDSILFRIVDGEKPYDGEIIWETSDESIATVSDGVLTGESAGEVTISATVGEERFEETVTVAKLSGSGYALAASPQSLTVDPAADGGTSKNEIEVLIKSGSSEERLYTMDYYSSPELAENTLLEWKETVDGGAILSVTSASDAKGYIVIYLMDAENTNNILAMTRVKVNQ